MSDFNFKEGDLVYYPAATNEIMSINSNSCIQYLDIWGTRNTIRVFSDGKLITHNYNPAIFPATQEWYDKLVHVYPNLEKPPGKKTPKEIIQAMMNFGYDGVPCKTECGSDRYICIGILKGEFYSFQYDNDDDNAYSSGIPYHPKTGLKIVDFIDGKCVLENGEVVLED